MEYEREHLLYCAPFLACVAVSSDLSEPLVRVNIWSDCTKYGKICNQESTRPRPFLVKLSHLRSWESTLQKSSTETSILLSQTSLPLRGYGIISGLSRNCIKICLLHAQYQDNQIVTPNHNSSAPLSSNPNSSTPKTSVTILQLSLPIERSSSLYQNIFPTLSKYLPTVNQHFMTINSNMLFQCT